MALILQPLCRSLETNSVTATTATPGAVQASPVEAKPVKLEGQPPSDFPASAIDQTTSAGEGGSKAAKQDQGGEAVAVSASPAKAEVEGAIGSDDSHTVRTGVCKPWAANAGS